MYTHRPNLPIRPIRFTPKPLVFGAAYHAKMDTDELNAAVHELAHLIIDFIGGLQPEEIWVGISPTPKQSGLWGEVIRKDPSPQEDTWTSEWTHVISFVIGEVAEHHYARQKVHPIERDTSSWDVLGEWAVIDDFIDLRRVYRKQPHLLKAFVRDKLSTQALCDVIQTPQAAFLDQPKRVVMRQVKQHARQTAQAIAEAISIDTWDAMARQLLLQPRKSIRGERRIKAFLNTHLAPEVQKRVQDLLNAFVCNPAG